MQILTCSTCDAAPLDPPRQANGTWLAQCPDCLTDNVLEPDFSNVFLPLRFRVMAGAPARRPADRTDSNALPAP